MYMVTGSKEYEVFLDNYSKLTDILKLSFKDFIPRFITERMIGIEEESIGVKDFLKKIAACLKDGHTEHFYALLEIMKHHGKSSDEELAVAMEEKLSLN